MDRTRSALLALLLLAPALGAEEPPTLQGYRYELGLTGDATLANQDVRKELVPLLQQLDQFALEYLVGDRRNRSELDSLAPVAEQILALLAPTPPDDDMTMRGIEAVGSAISLLELFGRHSLAVSLAGSLSSKVSSLAAAQPWNPVLRAHAQGLALKRSLLTGGAAP